MPRLCRRQREVTRVNHQRPMPNSQARPIPNAQLPTLQLPNLRLQARYSQTCNSQGQRLKCDGTFEACELAVVSLGVGSLGNRTCLGVGRWRLGVDGGFPRCSPISWSDRVKTAVFHPRPSSESSRGLQNDEALRLTLSLACSLPADARSYEPAVGGARALAGSAWGWPSECLRVGRWELGSWELGVGSWELDCVTPWRFPCAHASSPRPSSRP